MYDGHAYWRSWVPENTLGWLARRRPDIVVARLMSPRALREVGEVCRELDVPWGLHVAEDLAIECLRQSGTAPSVVIATARFHVDRLDALGYVSAYVPRILDLAPTRVESTREVVLQINPSPELGGELFWQIAQELPDYRFVLLESWRLPAVEAEALERRAASAANVEFRRFEPERSKIYRDARVLLAPHQVDNNPRVAVEAQANGIPVVGSDLAGLREVIGGGGTLVAVDAPASVWANAIRDLVDDQQLYERVVGAALAHAEMADCQPLHAVNVLESVLLRTAQGGCQPAVTGPSPEC